MKIRSIFSLTLFVFAISLLTGIVSGSSSNSASPLPTPREDATVNFNFDGLMALCFGNPERVTAGVLDVHHHTPQLAVIRIKDGKSSKVATLSGEQMRNTFYLDVEGRPNTVSRYYAESMNDPNDFRWNVDFESDLHQRQLYVKEDKLIGKIHFGAGLFYATNLSEEKFRFYATDNPGTVHSFNRRVGAPAAKLNLMAGEALVIKGGKKTIRLVSEPGVRYEVSITNMPTPDMANMDHWLFYYDVMGEKVTQYMPAMISKTAFGPRPLLCQPAVFSKSKLD